MKPRYQNEPFRATYNFGQVAPRDQAAKKPSWYCSRDITACEEQYKNIVSEKRAHRSRKTDYRYVTDEVNVVAPNMQNNRNKGGRLGGVPEQLVYDTESETLSGWISCPDATKKVSNTGGPFMTFKLMGSLKMLLKSSSPLVTRQRIVKYLPI